MSGKRARYALVLLMTQVLAAAFFVADSLVDADEWMAGVGGTAFSWFEVGLAFTLMTGILLNAVLVRRLMSEARRREQSLALARGALGEVIAERFAEWKLSSAEGEVALYALKGCAIAEIADFRSAAPGTIRAQLSQVYAKAGVSSQAMLMSLFLDDLMDGGQGPPR